MVEVSWHVSEVAVGNEFERSNIDLVSQGFPSSCYANVFWVLTLGKIEGCATDSEGVPKGHALSPGLENGVDAG